MIKFFLKKNFCDIWDNLFYLILNNIIPVAVIADFWITLKSMPDQSALVSTVVSSAFFCILQWILFAWGANARKIADFNAPSWNLFFKSLKATFLPGTGLGLLISFLYVVTIISVPYYLNVYSSGNIIGILFVALICWFMLITACALQWFIPLYFLQEENTFFKCLKKSFIIFFDNGMFSFGMLVHNLALLILTILTFGLIPGLNGITLSCMNALRLRLYKYDWLEENPEYYNDKDKRKEVPWDSLIAEDKECLGSRKLSSFLFPWK